MTTGITGKIQPYLDAIGTEDGSDAMIAAMEAVETTFSIKEYTSTGVHEKYLIFAKGGVDFLLHDGIVDTVFFHLRDSDKYAAYAHPDALVDGVRFGMSRDEVIEQLGTPRQNKKRYLLYPAGDAFVNIQFRDEHVLRVNAQRQDYAAQAEAEQEKSVLTVAPKPITGEISQLIDAAGSAYGDPVMLDLVELLGPCLDSHDIDAADGSGTLLVFDSGGVDLQYRDDALLAVLIHVREGVRRPYPRLDALVDGLSFPATREDVHAALGAPNDSRSDLDLYSEKGRHVMFKYDGDALTTISIVHVPSDT